MFFFVFRWVENLKIKWKTKNLKIKEPEPDEDEQEFCGQDLEVAKKHAKYVKHTLRTMGITNRDDRDEVIDHIKVLIAKEEDAPTDPWDKDQHNDDKIKPKKSLHWD